VIPPKASPFMFENNFFIIYLRLKHNLVLLIQKKNQS
jgi:hypothetical protein